jgi:hypothetical protein
MPKPEKNYGRLHLSSKDFPFLKDVSIGEVVELTVKLKVKELRQPDMWEVSQDKVSPKDILVSGPIVKIEKEKEEKNEKK